MPSCGGEGWRGAWWVGCGVVQHLILSLSLVRFAAPTKINSNRTKINIEPKSIEIKATLPNNGNQAETMEFIAS
jgi:hypothetical protein